MNFIFCEFNITMQRPSLQITCLILCSFTPVVDVFHVSHRTKREVSEDLVQKHILQNNGHAKEIPYHEIEQAFDHAQKKFNQRMRKRHLFIVTKNVSMTKNELESAYIDKVDQHAVKEDGSKSNFFVYKINLKELRDVPVSAVDLTISLRDTKYKIDDCYVSDSGTFNLGALIKNWKGRRFEINHVSGVILNERLKCTGFPVKKVPPHTCPT